MSEGDPRRSSDRRFDYADFGPPIRVSGRATSAGKHWRQSASIVRNRPLLDRQKRQVRAENRRAIKNYEQFIGRKWLLAIRVRPS